MTLLKFNQIINIVIEEFQRKKLFINIFTAHLKGMHDFIDGAVICFVLIVMKLCNSC